MPSVISPGIAPRFVVSAPPNDGALEQHGRSSTARVGPTCTGRLSSVQSLCGVAQAGQVLISQATYDLIHDRVEATPITGLRLKGVDHEVTAYEVRRVLE